jgi:DNA-directed RNA polymerase specialized sigma24 family protein
MSGDRGEAEDLVQECLLRLARRWPRVRSMEHPGAYARRVLFNLALDGGGKRTRRHRELQAAETWIALLTREADEFAGARDDCAALWCSADAHAEPAPELQEAFVA